jgi:hypothetical protein
MKKYLVFLLLLTIFLKSEAQTTSSTDLQESLLNLKQYIRDWSCETYLENSFTEKIKITIQNEKLIIQYNYENDDIRLFGLPEYSKTYISLNKIKSISAQDNDKQCAGIFIKTLANGLEIKEKYKYNNYETPIKDMNEMVAEIGWVNDNIRIKRTSEFYRRSNTIINEIKNIAKLSGNTILQN